MRIVVNIRDSTRYHHLAYENVGRIRESWFPGNEYVMALPTVRAKRFLALSCAELKVHEREDWVSWGWHQLMRVPNIARVRYTRDIYIILQMNPCTIYIDKHKNRC